ncbi:hypothetical protein F5Y17DRAFT_276871 [Xylariaceae sp. FL0594]|nr:hypothetical protein F5Y17DRAFT_276871 [Xylariaceae sp. FL0594]
MASISTGGETFQSPKNLSSDNIGNDPLAVLEELTLPYIHLSNRRASSPSHATHPAIIRGNPRFPWWCVDYLSRTEGRTGKNRLRPGLGLSCLQQLPTAPCLQRHSIATCSDYPGSFTPGLRLISMIESIECRPMILGGYGTGCLFFFFFFFFLAL